MEHFAASKHWRGGVLERFWRVRGEELEWTRESSASRVRVECESKILKTGLENVECESDLDSTCRVRVNPELDSTRLEAMSVHNFETWRGIFTIQKVGRGSFGVFP